MRSPIELKSTPRVVLLSALVAIVSLMALWFHLVIAAPLVAVVAGGTAALPDMPRPVAITLDVAQLLRRLVLPLMALTGVFCALSVWRSAPEAPQRVLRRILVILAIVLVPLTGWLSVCTFLGASHLAAAERSRATLFGGSIQDLAALSTRQAVGPPTIARSINVHRRLQRAPLRELRLVEIGNPEQLPLIEQQKRAIALIQWLELTPDPDRRRSLLASSLSWRAAFESMSEFPGDQNPTRRLLGHARRAVPDEELPDADAWFEWLENEGGTGGDWSAPPVLRLAIPDAPPADAD